jgi:hypothetical protein
MDDLVTFPLFWDVKYCPVTACGVIRRHKWWVHWKGIGDVCVDWTVKPMHLPIRGNCLDGQTHAFANSRELQASLRYH